MKGKTITAIFVTSLCIVPLLAVNLEYNSGSLRRFTSYFELQQFLQRWIRYWQERSIWASAARLGSIDSNALKTQSGSDYSITNIQVQGVDEADTVKTDGEHIYAISGANIIITKAYPAEDAKIISRIAVNGSPKQMFINKDRLVVFYENGSYYNQQTIINVYGTSDKETPTLIRTEAMDGAYLTSRMIGDYIYVIMRMPVYFTNGQVELPKVVFQGKCQVIPATDIYHSSVVDYDYFFSTIIAMNIFENEQEPNSRTIMTGYSTNIYVSQENIYLTNGVADKTFLHRIHIENGEIGEAVECEVPGTVLNQFSMDEYNGNFRIATTKRTNEITQNNLYILNMEMSAIGKIEDIAPGETIDSARFIADRCYLSTSIVRRDPFFVIDLTNPQKPTILGYLKIPGFTRYLHPYDETHVVGIGQENSSVKVSLFDVSNVNAPIEQDKYVTGTGWYSTPVLTEHKAFLFDKERELLVLPMEGYSYSQDTSKRNQAAFVFTVSAESQGNITLKGTITHQENGTYNQSRTITRSLYIGDVLYTVSDSMIKMNSLIDLTELNKLNLNY